MILNAFAQYLKQDKTNNAPFIVLNNWLLEKLAQPPQENVDKIIHKEIAIIKNEKGVYLLVGKSPSGITLLEALYNFAQSYEQQNFTRWVHKIKASDFNELVD